MLQHYVHEILEMLGLIVAVYGAFNLSAFLLEWTTNNVFRAFGILRIACCYTFYREDINRLLVERGYAKSWNVLLELPDGYKRKRRDPSPVPDNLVK